MDRTTAFESRLAELVARIDDCPAEARAALHALAGETRERQAAIETDIAAAKAGLETLALTEQLAALNLSMVVDAVSGLKARQG